ncbi:MAG TPA: ABC transporter permease [Candidatus Baltobacteraceae bacterium]|nr:ABC transporter permease [Candidatus Baltobacteraceae bacterium]
MQSSGWIWQDVRYGARTLWKDKRFASVAIVALALGIGAATVMFSVVYAVLIAPFPYRNTDRFVTFFIHDVTRPKGWRRLALSVPEFTDFREQTHVFEEVFGFGGMNVLYTANGETDYFDGCWVSDNISSALGMKPELGRPLSPSDAEPGAPPVFLMTDRLWTKQFNRDPKILGTVMTLNGTPRTLVEIAPPRYVMTGCDIWIPTYTGHADIVNSETGNVPMYLETSEHLKPGVTIQQAQADVDVVIRHIATLYPDDFPKQFTVQVMSVANYVAGDFKSMLLALMGAVLMLLLIACTNIANLLLARATAREKEIAIRTSLGASRGRLIRQLLVESFLISVVACVFGCFFAYFGVKEVVARLPLQTLTESISIELNFQVLLFAAGVAVLTTFLCGLAPAMHAVRGALQAHLSGTGRGMSAGARHGRLRSALVVGEVALSVLLLAGAGLLMRSLLALQHVDLGFNPKNVLNVDMAFPNARYGTAEEKRHFLEQVLARVKALPGVEAATVVFGLPPFGSPNSDLTIPGKTHSQPWNADFDLCDQDYFKVLGLPLLRGRLLDQQDVDSASRVIVINQTMARAFFSGEDPIGKTVKFNVFDQIADGPHDAYFQIIGIVPDAKNAGLRNDTLPQAFMPYSMTGVDTGRAIMMRTAVAPLSLLPEVRRQIWDVDSNVAISESGTLESYLFRYGYAQPEFSLMALGAFAGIGLVLVIVGVFSVMAYSVSLQTHEIGVRIALGAQPNDILRMVLSRGTRLIVVGLAIGLVASLGLTRFLSSEIWGISATDPLTFGAVAVLILAVGLAACAVPSRAATQVDPMVALRYE